MPVGQGCCKRGVRRVPGILLSAGDPASLSVNIRNEALAALLHELTIDVQEWPWWDNDMLRRFAHSDLGGAALGVQKWVNEIDAPA